MSGPSDKAVEAAANGWGPGSESFAVARTQLRRAHDPALGLDRSVCLRDVVAKLREFDVPLESAATRDRCADFIEREFTKEST